MQKFVVWCPSNGDAFCDGLRLEAFTHQQAAELWAEEKRPPEVTRYTYINVFVTRDLPREHRDADEIKFIITVHRKFDKHNFTYAAKKA